MVINWQTSSLSLSGLLCFIQIKGVSIVCTRKDREQWQGKSKCCLLGRFRGFSGFLSCLLARQSIAATPSWCLSARREVPRRRSSSCRAVLDLEGHGFQPLIFLLLVSRPVQSVAKGC